MSWLNTPSVNVFENGFIQSWNRIVNKTEKIRTSEKVWENALYVRCAIHVQPVLYWKREIMTVYRITYAVYTKKTVQVLEESFDEKDQETDKNG